MSDDAHCPQPANASPLPWGDGVGVRVGTLSKSLGSYGGYIAGSQKLIDYLQSSARSLIFSTGLPPSVIAAALAALNIAEAEPWRAEKAIENAHYFACNLQLATYNSSIVSYVLGTSDAAITMHKKLKSAGFWVPAIRPPTVPEGKARLRFSFTAAHDKKHIDEVIACLKS